MPIAATPVADEVSSQPDLHAAAVCLLPTRAALLDRIIEQTAASDVSPAALVLIGLLRRATLCLTAARSIGGGRVIRYSGTHR